MNNTAYMTQHELRRSSHHDLTYPWESQGTPLAADIEEATRAWVLQRGLLSPQHLETRYEPLNIGLLTALTYPSAPLDKSLTISKFLTWIFIQDDHYDIATLSLDPGRLRRKLDSYIQILGGAGEAYSMNVTFTALAEIVDLITTPSDTGWKARFSKSLIDFWLSGVLVETDVRLRDVVMDLPTYMKMRRYSIGVIPVLDLVEFAYSFVLPDHIVQDPRIQQVQELATQLVIYTNDIFSYRKERKARDPNNLIHILMHHHELSFADAVRHTVQLHNADVTRFLALTRDLPDWGPTHNANVTTYIDGCRNWIRGALDWQLIAGRYASGRTYLDSMPPPG